MKSAVKVVVWLVSFFVAVGSGVAMEIDRSDSPLVPICIFYSGPWAAIDIDWSPHVWSLSQQETCQYWSPDVAGVHITGDGKVIVRFVLSQYDINFLSRKFAGTDTRVPFALEIDVVDHNTITGEMGKDDFSIADNLPWQAVLLRDIPDFDDIKQLSAVIIRPDRLAANTVYEIVFTPRQWQSATGDFHLNFQLTVNYKYIAAMKNGYSDTCDILYLMNDLRDTVGEVCGNGFSLVADDFGSGIPSSAVDPWYYFSAARTDSSRTFHYPSDGGAQICWNDRVNPAHNDSSPGACRDIFQVTHGGYYDLSPLVEDQPSGEVEGDTHSISVPPPVVVAPPVYPLITELVAKGLELGEKSGISHYSPGERVLAEAYFKNIGEDCPDDVRVKFYLSEGEKVDRDKVKVGEGRISREHLESGETDIESITFTAPTAAGVYNVTACVDTEDAVEEIHESNNCTGEAVFKVTSDPPSAKGMQFLADVTGDGRADALVFLNTADHPGEWWVAESASDNTFRKLAPWGKFLGYGSKTQFLADVDADGRADLIMFFDDASHFGEWWVALAHPDGYFYGLKLWISWFGVGSYKQFAADVNGDRFADAVVYYEHQPVGNPSHQSLANPNGDWYVALATASNTFAYTNTRWATWLGKGSKRQFLADVNADGKADVVLFYDDAYHPGDWFVGLANSRGTFDYTGTYWGRYLGQGSQMQFLADINGDRFADLVLYFDKPQASPALIGQWWGAVSTGQYFTNVSRWADQVGSGIFNADGTRNGQLMMGDVNGDRYADIGIFYDMPSRQGEWWIDRANPSVSLFQPVEKWAAWIGVGSCY